MKKTPYLKTLYLQKPLVLILLIAAFATLPWLGTYPFLPGTEQHEVTVMQSFLTNGNLQSLNTPEAHSSISRLLVAGFVSFTGQLTAYVLRLPSALAFIAMMGFCFMFFAHRRPVLEAFTSVLILITSFGLYFSATVANAYMLPAFLVVGGVFEFYRWLETRRALKLITTWLFWGGAFFELGIWVLVAPFAALLIYLIARRKPISEVILQPLLVGIPALLIGFVLYWLFFSSPPELFSFQTCETLMSSSLGSKILAPFSGFMPWVLLLIVALLCIPFIQKSDGIKNYNIPPVLPLDKVSQFNLLVAIIPFIGFLIVPSSALSEVFFIVCLLFTAIFLSRLIVHLSDVYPFAIRVFSILLTIATLLVVPMQFAILNGIIDSQSVWAYLPYQHAWGHFLLEQQPDGGIWLEYLLLAFIIAAVIVNICFLSRRKNLKVLMATVALIFALQLYFNCEILPNYRGFVPNKENINKK